MTNVAWGRGFFRVWMLCAVLWLISWVTIGYGLIANPYLPPKVVATPVGGTVELYDRYGAQQREFAEGVAVGGILETPVREGYFLYTRADIEPARLTERLEEARQVIDNYIATETTSRRTSAIGTVLGWTILPPLIVLMLGWAIGWALSGFRKVAH